MMTYRKCMRISLASGALSLGACGGGGGGISAIATVPITAPPTTPAPAPAPTQPPIPAGLIGLRSSAPFSTVAASAEGPTTPPVQFSYSSATDRYTISIPGFPTGELVTLGGNGTFNSGASTWIHLNGTFNAVTVGSSSVEQGLRVSLDWPPSSTYTYTNTGSWFLPMNSVPAGVFGYGIPTAMGDVPLTGAATYAGEVQGAASDAAWVGGSVSLTFDFGAGSLSGVMKPRVAPVWDVYALGDYTFRNTAFAKGSTSFSGAFNVTGSTAPSSFQGSFNGPQAAELMANWTAPYLNPETNHWGTISGIWTAKKP